MAKHAPVDREVLLSALQSHARYLAVVHAHTLEGVWYQAKRKYGKGARGTTCEVCGADVWVLPAGNPALKKAWREVPAILGEAVFVPCPLQGRLL